MPEKNPEKNNDRAEAGKKDQTPEALNKPVPPLEAEVLEQLPPEIRKSMEVFFSLQRISGPTPPLFLNKINEDHITKVLDITDRDSQRDFDDLKSARKYHLVYFILAALLFVFAVVYLGDRNPESVRL
jgi:hypothetical protein